MRLSIRTTVIALLATQAPVAWSAAAAQARPAAAGAQQVVHACSLLSVADVRRLAGRADYPDDTFGDAPGEGAGGGSSCNYGGQTLMPGDYPPRVALVLVPPNAARRLFDSYRDLETRRGHAITPVPGVGSDAYAYTDGKELTLHVATGGPGLIVLIELVAPATAESMRPIAVALAKAAVARLP